jgi:hypothetical protein
MGGKGVDPYIRQFLLMTHISPFRRTYGSGNPHVFNVPVFSRAELTKWDATVRLWSGLI